MAHDNNTNSNKCKAEKGADGRQLAEDVNGKDSSGNSDDATSNDGCDVGRMVLGVHLGGNLGEETILGHGVEHAGLGQEQDHEHRRQTSNGTHSNKGREPRKANLLSGIGDRMGNTKLGVGHHARDNQAHSHVQHGAHGQRPKDTDGEVTLGVFGLLAGGGNCVKSDEGKEYGCGCLKHTCETVAAKAALVCRHEGRPIVRVDLGRACNDKHNDDHELNHHNASVEPCRLLGAKAQNGRDEKDNDDGRQTDVVTGGVETLGLRVPCEGRLCPLGVEVHVEDCFQKGLEVCVPAHSHGRSTHGVFENHRPTVEPCGKLTHCCVNVSEGAARNRNHSTQLGVAQACKSRSKRGNDEGKHDGWAGVLCRCSTSNDENTRTNDASNTQHHKVQAAK
eukprot:comp11893_c0_seq1/m.6538 comp11893_c0_seq1/g.6538  ORF comp11893_c0_seq1/g.6538 comp11893_c0_seq1/m.6538 type:complete len:392 (+) comp11893_c0_seq1:683-1858(+)